jgi:DNA ligase-1
VEQPSYITLNKVENTVFEVALDAVHRSTRHKSGDALRFPRINRMRWDKPAREADELQSLAKWLD